MPLEVKLRELASGPRVDNEPVWEFLDRCEQMEEYARQPEAASKADLSAEARLLPGFGLGLNRGRAVRHLGSFAYDMSGHTKLPVELLVSNVGATIEVRISGRAIGLGITEDEWRAEEARLEAEVVERIERETSQGQMPRMALERMPVAPAPADEYRGRWRLGWRGLEHARINREIRIASAWYERRAAHETNKRLRRGPAAPRPAPRTAPLPRKEMSEEALRDAAWSFWAQRGLERRELWGTDVYTDDSDILAMCVHAGWIEAPHIPDVPEWLSGGGGRRVAQAWNALTERQHVMTHGTPWPTSNPGPAAPAVPVCIAPHATCDLSVVLRIAPKLIVYKGCHRGGVRSRSWGNTHDGVSLVVESVELRPPNYATGTSRRAAKARMAHMTELRSLARLGKEHKDMVRLSVPSNERPFWDVPQRASAA